MSDSATTTNPIIGYVSNSTSTAIGTGHVCGTSNTAAGFPSTSTSTEHVCGTSPVLTTECSCGTAYGFDAPPLGPNGEVFKTIKTFKICANSRASCDQHRGGRSTRDSLLGLGPIVFLDQITIPIHYLNFTRKAFPSVIFHIGCESPGQHGQILVPVGTRYKVVGGIPGTEIIQRLQEAQKFFFDVGTQIIIPENLPFSFEGEKEMFCQDTVVTMV